MTMKKLKQDFDAYVSGLHLDEGEKERLLHFSSQFEKENSRSEFKMNRILKDKTIIINLLNASIEDLTKQQAIIELSNEELSRKKEEIEAKNAELNHQKWLVEEQSRKLEENLKKLELSYHELEQFSYIASHDLKSPLRTIASYAQLLQRRYIGKFDTDADEFIRFIVKGASSMNEIIRDLLEYSKVGKEKPFENIDLNDMMELVKFNLRHEIMETKALVEHENLPVLYAHRSGMLQIFQNLVANAIKFRGDKSPRIRVGIIPDGGNWLCSVSDNGLGLDETYMEKAFQPFERVSHLDRPGTGMGLAICRKIVKLHGGDIWYKSQPGQGTTFHFTLAQG